MRYVRTVKTASGATAVQIVYSFHHGSREIEHIGSAHDDGELELLKAAARQRLAAGQGELDLGLDTAAAGGPLPIIASQMGCLLDALLQAYDLLGFGQASGVDGVFRGLVLARIIEPVSKSDSLRVLDEAGLASPSHATLKRRLPAYAKEAWRRKISAACAAHAGLGRASLPLLSVTAGTAVMDLPGWPAAPGRTLRLRTDMRLRTDIEPTGCRPPSISCSSS